MATLEDIASIRRLISVKTRSESCIGPCLALGPHFRVHEDHARRVLLQLGLCGNGLGEDLGNGLGTARAGGGQELEKLGGFGLCHVQQLVFQFSGLGRRLESTTRTCCTTRLAFAKQAQDVQRRGRKVLALLLLDLADDIGERAIAEHLGHRSPGLVLRQSPQARVELTALRVAFAGNFGSLRTGVLVTEEYVAADVK